MTNQEIAKIIFEDLNKKGADLGNVSISLIKKTLDRLHIGKKIDAELQRPKSNDSIYFECANGEYQGVYLTHGSGQVKVQPGGDIVEWEDVYSWFPAPDNI